MADLQDVNTALVALIGSVCYPNGTGNPVSPLTGGPVKVYEGWPTAATLDADLRASEAVPGGPAPAPICHVTVFSGTEGEKNTTRFPTDVKELTAPPPATIVPTIDATGTQITLTGSMPSPWYAQNVAVIVNNQAFIYQTVAGDTLQSVAAALAALINPAIAASAAGAVITIATAHALVVRVGTLGTSMAEIRRQERAFRVTLWCPTPESRKALAPPIDSALGSVKFLTLADGSAGRIIYRRTIVNDELQKENLWRRDLIYTVEYPTTTTEIDATVVVTNVDLYSGNSAAQDLDPNGPLIGSYNY